MNSRPTVHSDNQVVREKAHCRQLALEIALPIRDWTSRFRLHTEPVGRNPDVLIDKFRSRSVSHLRIQVVSGRQQIESAGRSRTLQQLPSTQSSKLCLSTSDLPGRQNSSKVDRGLSPRTMARYFSMTLSSHHFIRPELHSSHAKDTAIFPSMRVIYIS